MNKRVQIISRKLDYKRFFFAIEEVRLRHELYNGRMSAELTRLSLNRGDSVAAVMFDPDDETVIVTEQFRFPTYDKGPGWILEIPAGTIEADETDDPLKTLRRELMEEIGYRVTRFEHISTFYVSPGGTSERIHLYFARVSAGDRKARGGGLISEGEDIRILALDVEAAFRKLANGEIVDAKTMIGLQWLQLHRSD